MSSKKQAYILSALWDTYQLDGYGHLLEAGTQATECKRAFYAGAFKALVALTHAVSDGPEPTDGDTDLLDMVMEEASAFFQAESAVHKAQQH